MPLAPYELQNLEDDLNHDRPIPAELVRRLMDERSEHDELDDDERDQFEWLKEQFKQVESKKRPGRFKMVAQIDCEKDEGIEDTIENAIIADETYGK